MASTVLYNLLLCLCIITIPGFVVMSEAKPKEYYAKIPRVNFSKADDLQKSDAVYRFFKDATITEGKIITEETAKEEISDKNISTVLIMHGWTTNEQSPWYAPLKDRLFEIGPHNVLYLDWSIAGNKSYGVSSANTKPMGKIIAEFLLATGVPPSKIHLIGHSLGAQLASFIGKHTVELSGQKIGRITALDPAGPCWTNDEMDPIKERLCSSDADFVDVIHSDIFYSGFTAPIGHVDFYPNDGKHQPGCPPRDVHENCSHARSVSYFIESVIKQVNATEAEFKQVALDAVFTRSENPKQVVFGFHVDKSAQGVYTLETNSTRPFLK